MFQLIYTIDDATTAKFVKKKQKKKNTRALLQPQF